MSKTLTVEQFLKVIDRRDRNDMLEKVREEARMPGWAMRTNVCKVSGMTAKPGVCPLVGYGSMKAA